MTKPRTATIKNKSAIWTIFKMYRKILPHIRTDYLQRHIESKNVIYEKKVVIIWQQYQRAVTLGNQKIAKGTYIVHQIVNGKQGDGNANKVLNKFLKTLPIKSECILTVRRSNHIARRFYKKNGFRPFGIINWSNNKIDGLIYKIKIKA